jgi:Flp pilus assembly pilin Flp
MINMNSPRRFARRLIKNDRGATAVEYALMLVMILLIVFAAFKALGKKVEAKTKESTTALG